MALLWIIAGAVFDFFDGMSARLLNVSSPIGKELDSLADDVTFGVAPAAIIFRELQTLECPDFLAPVAEYLPYFAFVMAAFSALRLAKFNLDTRQTTSFIVFVDACQRPVLGLIAGIACRLVRVVSAYGARAFGDDLLQQLALGG